MLASECGNNKLFIFISLRGIEKTFAFDPVMCCFQLEAGHPLPFRRRSCDFPRYSAVTKHRIHVVPATSDLSALERREIFPSLEFKSKASAPAPETIHADNLLRKRPAIHDAPANQQIVLMIVRRVRERRGKVVDLPAHGESPGDRDIDSSARTRSKPIRSVTKPGRASSGMRRTNQNLCERLHAMCPVNPRTAQLRQFVSPAREKRSQRQRTSHRWRSRRRLAAEIGNHGPWTVHVP